MKTPHRITLVYSEGKTTFDPITGKYESGAMISMEVPCFINFPTKQTQFEQYGSREENILIARFNHEPEPFTKAIYKGKTYAPIEELDAPVKGSIRMREVDDYED